MFSSLLLHGPIRNSIYFFISIFLFGPRCWSPLWAAWLVVFRSGLGSAVVRGRFGGGVENIDRQIDRQVPEGG